MPLHCHSQRVLYVDERLILFPLQIPFLDIDCRRQGHICPLAPACSLDRYFEMQGQDVWTACHSLPCLLPECLTDVEEAMLLGEALPQRGNTQNSIHEQGIAASRAQSCAHEI